VQIVAGVVLAAIVAAIAHAAGSLTRGGAVAAFVVGAIVFSAGGWPGSAVLFAFFIPSTLLSRVGRARKRSIESDAQHGARNGWQVAANGGVAAFCALAGTHGGALFAAAFAGAFAAASADTWATEIGMLSRSAPVSIVTFESVAPGFSGGVTPLGIAATVAGALWIGAVAAAVHLAPFWCVALGGVAGTLLDSLAGATVQALRWCPRCGRHSEFRRHGCGAPTELRRGVGWIENDAVNFGATLCGAIVAAFASAQFAG